MSVSFCDGAWDGCVHSPCDHYVYTHSILSSLLFRLLSVELLVLMNLW